MSNKKLLIGLVIFILLAVTIGSVGLYSFYRSNEKAITYYHTAKGASEIQSIYQAQISVWKDMMQRKEDSSIFHNYYYVFSKLSDRIQDGLFNLKIKFMVEEDNTWEKVEQLRILHQKISEKYVTIIFDKKVSALSLDPSSIMKEYEKPILDGLDDIAASSMNIADKEIGRSVKYYFPLMISFLIILTALAIILIVTITKGKRD
jgi:hypothetical protein